MKLSPQYRKMKLAFCIIASQKKLQNDNEKKRCSHNTNSIKL